MLELFEMAKDLGYDDGYDVSFYGEEFGTSRLIQIISDSTLLACMSMVPKSNSKVIVLYLKVVSLTSSQVGNDSSDQEYSCSEDDDSSDPDFEDIDYAQSDEEINLLKKDDKWFEGYVDHSIFDNDPNAEENDESDNEEESPTLTCPNSSQSEDDAMGELRRKKNRMPKGEDFRPEIDMANPGFKIEQVHQDYGYRPSRATVYRARAMAVDILSKPAHDWLVEKDPKHWSRAYFKSDSKCDMLMNNLCEAFNRSIMDARDKPILTMLERIRLYIMLLMARRKVFCEK
ncbi:unnamed protein product [Prunus brigantina]